MPARTPHSHPLLVVLLLLATPVAARADGVPVGPAPTEAQSHPTVGSDGRGGAVVSYKTASLKVGAVRVNAAGSPNGGLAIAPAVVPLPLELDGPLRVALSSDSQVVFVSDRAAQSGPAVTRLGTGGTTSPGFPVSLAMPLRHPAVVPGLAGRTLLVAKDSDAISFWTLRAAIIDASGNVEFSIEIPSTIQFFNSDAIDACSDGAGGLIAAMPFYDAVATGSKDIAVFHLAANGSRPWAPVATPLITASNDQTDVHIVPDGANGALMVWTDPRAVSRATDIFAMRLDAQGERAPGWSYYGSPVCDALGPQSQPRIASDGTGGVWVVWLDQRAGVDGDLRYSHMLGSGTLAPGFTGDGRVLCGAVGAQREAALAGDGAGGCFAVWRDDRSGISDLYVQHVLANGLVAPGWAVDGRPLTTAAGIQDEPAISSVSGGHAVVAWRDARAGTTRIYAAGVDDPSTTAVAGDPPGLMLATVAAARGEARVRLSLTAAGPAVLELLDVSGRTRARTDLEGPLTAHEVTLASARTLAPGLYFARLRQHGVVATARVTLLR